MEDLKRGRRPVRREFNSLCNDLESLLKEVPLKVDTINIKFKLFLDAWDNLHNHDEMIVEQLNRDNGSEEDENKEWDEIQEFKYRAEAIRQLKEKFVPVSSQVPVSESVTGGIYGEGKIRNFKLPSVKLKKFTGDLKDWLRFWAQFQKIHEDPHMNGGDKYWYLLEALEPNTDAYEIATLYPQSNENYDIVIEALRKRYGNEDLQLQVYIRELLSLVISNVGSKNKLPIKSLFLKLDSHLRALKTLNLEKADPATWLFPLVESCLPETILYNWQRSPLSTHDGSIDDPPRTRLELLMSFVEKEVEILQRIDLTKTFANQHTSESIERKYGNRDKKLEKRAPVPTLSSFHVGERMACVFCGRQNHESEKCFNAKKMKMEEKLSILKSKGLCFKCTGKHLAINCKTENLQCSNCKRNHFTVLCRDVKLREERRTTDNEREEPSRKRARQTDNLNTNLPIISATNLECSNAVALQTLLVNISNGGIKRTVRAFIDSGSQRSYILKTTATALNLEPAGTERVVHSLFGGRKTTVLTQNKYTLNISSITGGNENIIEVRDQEKICDMLPVSIHNHSWLAEELKRKNIYLSDIRSSPAKIEILIGADVYARLLTGTAVKLSSGATAVETTLGWTLLGDLALNREDNMANLNTSLSTLDLQLTKLWDLEAIGIMDSTIENNEKARYDLLKETFSQNISRNTDGRYSVKLPWKNTSSCITTNRAVAYKRLQCASKKLLEKGLFTAYNKIFSEWEDEHFIERVPVPDNVHSIHYVPHRPVVKESLTTPVRPVFDASCRVEKSPSLNDLLFTGENLVRLIPELLYRFREKSVAFVADIRKAFQMIEVEKADRDMMRFLWWKDESMKEVIEYRHTRVMFGATCSPFILAAVLHHHLSNLSEDFREFGLKLLSTFYVDNAVYSVNTKQDYHEFKYKAVEVMSEAGMDLRMWLSNVEDFNDPSTEVVSVLGLQWDRKRDQLFINVRGITTPEKINKRSILAVVQKVFDPIGVSSPAILPIKLLLQKLWRDKLKWDDPVDDKDKKLFQKWCAEVVTLGNLRIPRLITGGVIDREKWSIHTFCDASKSAYSAVTYLRIEHRDGIALQLLAAKSRVAPEKTLTIPKLELMGAVIGVRLTVGIMSSLNLEDITVIYWLDSTTALAWIYRDDQWGTFVGSKVKEIRSSTQAQSWRHIPGINNPADLPSRGCFPSQLVSSRWWEGPQWLYLNESEWPKSTAIEDESEIVAERRKSKFSVISSFSISEWVQNSHSFHEYVRIIGWVRRFLFNRLVNTSEGKRRGDLSRAEIGEAEKVLILNIQREAFPPDQREQLKSLEIVEDEWGILRVKTRLSYRNDPINFKYPMLLPSKKEEVRQLIRDFHRYYCHAGVGFLVSKLRQKYWIIKARHTVKGVVSRCPKCRRYSAKPTIPEAAPLPLDRVKSAEVFEVVGIDLAGPLIMKNGKKIWIVIYTCAVYRAVYFDLVHSVSTKAFLQSLEKFIEKFRRPEVIHSDNGTNFRGANNLFKQIDWGKIEGNEKISAITWKFNPVYSSWWGGWWERLIRTAKDLLRKTVGKRSLNLKELKAVIINIGEIMNYRPLTYVSEDPSDLEPLTPHMFLHPFGITNFPEMDLIESDKLRFRYNYVQTLKKELQGRFLKEYLSMLINRNAPKAARDLTVGDLVLVGCDNLKRMDWPLGKIVELIPGKDKEIRLATVKTLKGDLVRSVQRLYRLELETDSEEDAAMKGKIKQTKSGRQVKAPLRYT